MKIFISWSGDRAKAAAYLLRDWLPTVIQRLHTPWVSDVDIESGANWSSTIGAELTGSKFGIVCVTQENQGRPWLNFEAGAISKLVDGAVPLLIDFDRPADLAGGPLAQLQARMPDRDGMGKLLADINRRLDEPLTEHQLTAAVDWGYSGFDEKLTAIRRDPTLGSTVAVRRDTADVLGEILKLVRRIASAPRHTGHSNLPGDLHWMWHDTARRTTTQNLEVLVLNAVLRLIPEDRLDEMTVSEARELIYRLQKDKEFRDQFLKLAAANVGGTTADILDDESDDGGSDRENAQHPSAHRQDGF